MALVATTELEMNYGGNYGGNDGKVVASIIDI